MDSKPRRQASNQNVMIDGIKCSRKVKKADCSKNIFYPKKIFFQKPLPGPSAQIFIIAQKVELPKCWGAAAPRAPGSYAYG